jgi:hypothetical protein
MRVRRLRTEDQDDGDGTAQSPATTLHQRRARRHAQRRSVTERGWPRRSRQNDVEHGLAAFRLTPIRTIRAAGNSILQPTYVVTTRGTPRSERASLSPGSSSPVALESLPPLPRTPPPPYNAALQESGRVSTRQSWL